MTLTLTLTLARVRGRSMRPTLEDGDLLLVRRVRPGTAPRLRAGGLGVVLLPDGPRGRRGLAVKRLTHRVDDGWWVERDNPAEGVDSWLVGAVADADVRGVVIARIWPRPARLHARRPPGNVNDRQDP